MSESDIGGDLPPLDPELQAWLSADTPGPMPEDVWTDLQARLAAEPALVPPGLVDLATERTRRRSGKALPLLAGAAGLVLVCLSAVWLWLRRRDPGRLGAPPPGISPRRSVPLVATVVALGVLLPLFGLSLLAVLLLERFVLRRVAPVKTWLGLA